VENENVGKLIHATGDASEGFELEFVRNYDQRITRRQHQIVFLANVNDRHVVDTPGAGQVKTTDTNPVDDLERRAATIPTPGKSLVSAGSSSQGGKKVRVEIQNCQTWLRQVTVALVEDGILPADAIVNLDKAPKN